MYHHLFCKKPNRTTKHFFYHCFFVYEVFENKISSHSNLVSLHKNENQNSNKQCLNIYKILLLFFIRKRITQQICFKIHLKELLKKLSELM